MVMPYHLHMPSYFLETFTEYPTPNIRSITNYSLLQSMGNDKRHQRYKEQVSQRRG